MTNADALAPVLVRHPWNDHFERIPSRVESGVLDGATATAFDRDGYVVVVLSSLTPHLTGPNTTEDVRKSYILQYAPEGTRTLIGDPAAGPPTGFAACDDPARQFPVVGVDAPGG